MTNNSVSVSVTCKVCGAGFRQIADPIDSTEVFCENGHSLGAYGDIKNAVIDAALRSIVPTITKNAKKIK